MQNVTLLAAGEVTIGGEWVQLVGFAMSGLYALSTIPSALEAIRISVEFENRGKIDLVGSGVRFMKRGDV